MEEWKKLSDYDYQISSFGRIKRGKNSSVPLWISKKGYYYTKLWKNDEYKNKFIHRLVGETFIDNPEHKPIIDHINGLRTDNRLCNLRWATSSENNLNRH